jgi:hypothetical protein
MGAVAVSQSTARLSRSRARYAQVVRDLIRASAELDALSPPADRDEWQQGQQRAAVQRLAVITGTHPHRFPNIGSPEQAWEWYRDNNPYATGALPRRHALRLIPPGKIAIDYRHVGVPFELPTAVAAAAGMLPDLRIHCSLVCVVLPLPLGVRRNGGGTAGSQAGDLASVPVGLAS